jgi:hypothetical protein
MKIIALVLKLIFKKTFDINNSQDFRITKSLFKKKFDYLKDE